MFQCFLWINSTDFGYNNKSGKTVVPVRKTVPVKEPETVRTVGGDEEREELEERLDPLVPPPLNVALEEDGGGWAEIDKVGGWDSFLSKVSTSWKRFLHSSRVWAWPQGANDGGELDRGLMWFCFLPHALFRNPRRGGKAGRGLLGTAIVL